jgi:hypothetical protein
MHLYIIFLEALKVGLPKGLSLLLHLISMEKTHVTMAKGHRKLRPVRLEARLRFDDALQ